jgi:hypothetical protein
VLDRHCRVLFMKHVLPRLDRPTAPVTTGDPVWFPMLARLE